MLMADSWQTKGDHNSSFEQFVLRWVQKGKDLVLEIDNLIVQSWEYNKKQL